MACEPDGRLSESLNLAIGLACGGDRVPMAVDFSGGTMRKNGKRELN
jgi:hypothetical protein